VKYLISIPLAGLTTVLLYLLDDRAIDRWYLVVVAIVFNVCYARVAEFLLKKPM